MAGEAATDGEVSPLGASPSPLGSAPPTALPSPSTAPAKRGGGGSGLRTMWYVLAANPLTLVGFLLVVLIVVTAVVVAGVPYFGHLLTGHSVTVLPYTPYSLTPDTSAAPNSQHWLGTDRLGVDIFTLVVAALPLDLFIAFSITGIALFWGGALGIIAGYWDRPGLGGVVSTIILRITDMFLAFPSLVLALAVAAALGRSTTSAIIALLVTWWPFYVRLTRGEVLAIRNQPYIIAARAAGVTDLRILVRHVLRNILEPLVVFYTLDVGTVLITFSTISYAGLAVPFGVPEWGNLVQSYSGELAVRPWTVLGPGLAIFVTVLSFSLLGDGLRDILDPRSRRILAQGPAAASTSPAAKGVGAVDA